MLLCVACPLHLCCRMRVWPCRTYPLQVSVSPHGPVMARFFATVVLSGHVGSGIGAGLCAYCCMAGRLHVSSVIMSDRRPRRALKMLLVSKFYQCQTFNLLKYTGGACPRARNS